MKSKKGKIKSDKYGTKQIAVLINPKKLIIPIKGTTATLPISNKEKMY